MNLERKFLLLRQNIESIAKHDDAPESEVKSFLDAAATEAKNQAAGLKAARATRAKGREAASGTPRGS